MRSALERRECPTAAAGRPALAFAKEPIGEEEEADLQVLAMAWIAAIVPHALPNSECCWRKRSGDAVEGAVREGCCFRRAA